MEDWRLIETFKRMRQCVTCSYCGALVSTTDGYQKHLDWHRNMNEWIQRVEDQFDVINNYVTDPENGLEKRFNDLISQASEALAQLRTDATNAIQGSNQAIAQLRSDATTAINEDRVRLSTIENEITKPGGILARIAALEAE